jgi:hypothetical protein
MVLQAILTLTIVHFRLVTLIIIRFPRISEIPK